MDLVLGREAADREEVTFTDCCGLRLHVVDFHLAGGELTMRYCKRCEADAGFVRGSRSTSV
jgi:hypothetical protein